MTLDDATLDAQSDRDALRADLLRTMHAAERAIAEMTRAANRVRMALGLPEEPEAIWPGALAQDAALARLGWAALSPDRAGPARGDRA